MNNTIGEQLKQAREAKGLSLEQVSSAIHIRTLYLEALENDQRAALPSNVQGRGFLRLYAGLLDLPVDSLLAAWDGTAPVPNIISLASDTKEISSPEPVEETPQEESPSPSAQIEQFPSEPAAPAESASETGSQAIFREIGQTLRSQRELLGLSLTEVERFTRLRQHYLQAMEEGRMEGLPSPVQGKGMLSNYAAFLNLDEDTILLRFADGLQARRIERLPISQPQGLLNTKKRPARKAPFWRRFLTPDLIFGVGLAAIILIFVLWTAARIDTQNTSQAEPTTPPIAEILLTPEAIRLTQIVISSPAFESTTVEGAGFGSPTEVVQPGSSIVDGLPEKTALGGAAPNAEQTPDPSSSGSSFSGPTATLPPINDDPLQVYIIAHARAWLQVIADGKTAFLGRVVPGNAYAFSGEKQIELLTGSGAALQVIFNQKDLGRLGITGEVVGLVFTIDGIMTPTPAFTATSTPTPPATITPLPSPTLPATPTITPFVP